MKKFIIGVTFFLSLAMTSCCGCYSTGEGEENNHHNDHHSNNHHEESELAFDGVDKGDYILYGHSDINSNGAKSVEAMFAQMQEKGSFTDKVQVNIVDVCQKAGCWITIDDKNGGTVRVFFRDHFTIPIETPTGTEAILYGSLQVDTLSVDFQKHLLDDAKEAGKEIDQAQYDAITEDKIEKTFDCESILIRKK